MKHLIIFLILLWAKTALGQTPDSTFIFKGYLLDHDSIPIENAYLINYRTVRGFATDKNGRFLVKAQLGDSVKINHVSYCQKVIYANTNPDSCNIFLLTYEHYSLDNIPISYKNVEQEHLEKNMTVIEKQFEIKPLPPQYFRGTNTNPYAPGAYSPGFGLRLGDIVKLFKKKKK